MWRRLTRCVEVGVELAEYSRIFVNRHWNLELFIGVDSYDEYEEMPWDRASDYLISCQRYAQFGPKCKLIRGDSVDVAASLLAQQRVNGLWGDPFHIVYVDGRHSKDSVARDIAAWWPLLADKGIIAGHDWDHPDHPGVREAVIEFADANGLTVYYTYNDFPQSWIIYKSGMPGHGWERTLEQEEHND